ncbi:Adenylyl cyclase class-3/4/guanylyl cyclase [Trypanosoma melophagium]|uniref:Adenylyl cyclase class-3/4/guanylyl cyclase n=1 Tax=Trypanosoma melophagium TaxID=715481 RepID=UPI00351AA2B2|nr:Adenylyl cyclase class-3/4/guanylyl cyclase [Trypanosoma melophagium]
MRRRRAVFCVLAGPYASAKHVALQASLYACQVPCTPTQMSCRVCYCVLVVMLVAKTQLIAHIILLAFFVNWTVVIVITAVLTQPAFLFLSFCSLPLHSLFSFKIQAMCFHTPKATSAAHRGGSTYFRPLLSLTALLCLTQLLLYTPQSALCQDVGTQKDTVKLLALNLTNHPVFDSIGKPLNAGFMASLYARNFTVAGGMRVEIVTKETTVEEAGNAVEEALSNDSRIIALYGPFGDSTVYSVVSALVRHEAVSFGLFTGSSIVRTWSRNLYFVRAEPGAELLALVRYTVSELRVQRISFMYLQNINYGDTEFQRMKEVMGQMNYELNSVFTLKVSMNKPADGAVFNAAWEAFADTRPQAVIVFGAPYSDTAEFIMRMLTDKRTAGAYLLGPTAAQEMLIRVWSHAVNKGVPFVSGQVITTGTNPLATDPQYSAIKRFRIEMEDYLKNGGQTIFDDPQHFLNDDTDGETMVAGWMAGEVLVRAMSNPLSLKDRTTFTTSLFDQRRYLIDDLVIGDFGGDCSDTAVSMGAVCRCNQGGRTVYMKRFIKGFRSEHITKGRMTFDTAECYTTSVLLLAPLNGVSFFVTDSKLAMEALSTMSIGVLAALGDGGRPSVTHPLKLQTSMTTTHDAHNKLLGEMTVKRVHIVGGIATKAMLDVPNVTFIDPLFLQPRLNKFRRHVIHLSPTVEQELFVLAQYLGSTTGATAAAVIRCDEAAAVEDVLRRSLVTFGGSLESAALLAGGDSLAGRLPSSGAVFVVGLADGDAALIAGHLTKHSGVRVFVLFSELSLRYAEFTAAFDGSGSADRLVFATSLPHWADVKTESETVRKFHTAVKDETDRTPLSLRAFANVRLLQTVLSRMDTVNADTLSGFFYQNIAISAEDMLYGSFTDGSECAAQGIVDAAKCIVNYGATRISVWSMSRALNPTVSELFPPVTPSMEYVEPPKGGLTLQQLIGVIVGCVAGGVLLVGLILFLLLRRRSARDNANAPKEPTDPVTLVFTDIESSTALWAACPEIMPDAVATHHRLIRALIAKYRCYEVKTIGDSFMIASRSVFAAVQLVRELQQSFLHHDWGTGAIDDAYHEFEEGKAAEDDEYVPPTARLDAAVYRQYWNGLRVRAAVHTGLADIRHDEVTKGYDYYGSTSNTAARTESVANGGQVLLTRAAYMALSTAEREQVDVTALGPVALRGVPKPVEMYQLDAVPGRTFAALRLDREFIDFDESGSESQSVSSSSKNETTSSTQNALVLLLTGLFAPFPLQQRLKVLQTIAQRWNITVPSSKLNSPIDGCFYILWLLAEKLARVCLWKAELLRSGADLDLVSLFGSVGRNMGNFLDEDCSLLASSSGFSFQSPTWARSLADRSVASTETIHSRLPPGFLFS